MTHRSSVSPPHRARPADVAHQRTQEVSSDASTAISSPPPGHCAGRSPAQGGAHLHCRAERRSDADARQEPRSSSATLTRGPEPHRVRRWVTTGWAGSATAWITVADGQDGRTDYLHHGIGEPLHCPIAPEWEAVAHRHGMAVVSVGVDELAVDHPRDLSLYLLAYGHRAYIGVVPVNEGERGRL